MWFAGIDLAGKEENPTAICLYDVKREGFLMKTVYSDEQIIAVLDQFKPKIIAIDAPFTLPAEGKGFRKAEKELISIGYRPISLRVPSMRLLYDRAKRLLPKLMKYGEVIEVFSTASLSSLRITKDFVEKIFQRKISKDEMDAFACCMSAIYYHKGKYRELGNKEEGVIILPVLLEE